MNTLPVRRIGIGFLVFVMTAVWGASAGPKPQAGRDAASGLFSAGGSIHKAMGSPNAPIVMEVFGDFQCPACRNFFETTVKQVIDDYVHTGKVYLVHRDFPLEMHPYAMQAARLANAAAATGEFEAMERALYDHQDEWSARGNIDGVISASFTPAQFKKFQAYQAQHLVEINTSIERDRMLGVQRNVNQTPTVFVTSHGKTEALPGGGVDYKLLKQYFDYLMRQ